MYYAASVSSPAGGRDRFRTQHVGWAKSPLCRAHRTGSLCTSWWARFALPTLPSSVSLTGTAGKAGSTHYIRRRHQFPCQHHFPHPLVKKYVLIFLLLILAPVSVSAANYLLGGARGNWQTADRSSAGLLPNASAHPDALIRARARYAGAESSPFTAGSFSRSAARHATAVTTTPPGATRSASMALPRTDDGSGLRPNPSSPSMAGKQKNSFQKFVR